jgi:DNA modification methylase
MIPVSCDPEGKLDRVPLDQIEEFQGNLKSLGKTEYAKLKQSITEKGFVVPCFAWRNGSGRWKLLDGHQRVRVIRNEGWEIDGGIPIVEIAAEDERDAKEKLLAIVSRYGRVEGQGLYEFLDGTGIDLEQWAVPDLPDLDLDAWLDEFMRDPEVPPGDPEAVPEVPEEATTQLGDLWVLGDHRVICGDATSVDDVERLMGGEVATLMVTDPPYGVEYDASRRSVVSRDNSDRALGKVQNDDIADWSLAWNHFKGEVAYVYHADIYTGTVCQSLHNNGMIARSLIIWKKSKYPPVPYGVSDKQVKKFGIYHHQHEPCWYCLRDNANAKWVGGKSQTTVWEINSQSKSETGHSTQKPLECMERPIANHEGNVYDPFLGSGTTLIAAEKQKRRCFGLEIEPKYVDVIVRRWEDYTGKTAVLKQSKAA